MQTIKQQSSNVILFSIMETSILFTALTFVAFAAGDIQIVPIPDGLNGTGITTRYWDCCKPSCSWVENLSNTSATTAVRSCEKDGATTISVHEMSGCVDGGAFMCNDQQPWAVNDTFAFGFVAASFTGGSDVAKCCSCMLLSLQRELTGKQMAVQITNTGSDLYKNHFDIAMPGGGAGIYADGCTNQWDAPHGGWGDPIGGVTSEEECSELPEQLQSGCDWRFEWFKGVDNPDVAFYEIECPDEIISVSECQ